MMWGANEDQWVDYSPVNQAAFRRWLRQHYGTQERLQQAWGSDSVTFETATIPASRRGVINNKGHTGKRPEYS
jgi:beta-galactosidase GanA